LQTSLYAACDSLTCLCHLLEKQGQTRMALASEDLVVNVINDLDTIVVVIYDPCFFLIFLVVVVVVQVRGVSGLLRRGVS
jgi:hypothetical protein